MRISFEKFDITPDTSTNPFLGGYGVDVPRRVTTGSPHQPLYARCVILWEADHPHAIVVADVLGFPRSMHQAIRQRVTALHAQWGQADFVLQATHTHNGPVLKEKLDSFISYNMTGTDAAVVDNYCNWLEDRLVSLVATTLAASQSTCLLDYQVASESFASNRVGLPYTETAVPVLVARGDGGQPLAVLFSFGCHPVSANSQTQYDGDFPAGACKSIEDATGAFAMFIQGPAGDQNPTSVGGFGVRDQFGNQLAQTVLNAIQQRGRNLSGVIHTAYREIDLPLDISDTPANLADVRRLYQQRLSHELGFYRRHAQVMIGQIDGGSFDVSVPLPIQVWRLQGDLPLPMVFTGGELVSGYATYFRFRHGGPGGIFIGGYANEVPSYIPSYELLPGVRAGGSYEGGWDPDSPGIAAGSQTVYGYLGHYKNAQAGEGGVEDRVIQCIDSLLNATHGVRGASSAPAERLRPRPWWRFWG